MLRGKFKIKIYYIVVALYFLTEKWILNVDSGSFKGYFFISLLMCLVFFPTIARLTNTSVGIYSVLFVLSMLISSLVSDNMYGAFANTISSTLYLLTAYVIGALVLSNRVNLHEFQDFLRKILEFAIIYGLIQWVIFQVTHVALFDTGGLWSGQISGFSTEPNAHGKYVGAAIVYSIPMILGSTDFTVRRRYKRLLILAVVTMVISMTRNAVYACLATLIILTFYYMGSYKKFDRMFKFLVVIMTAMLAIFFLIDIGYIQLEGRSLEKIYSLFMSLDELEKDGSGSFRLPAMIETMKAWLNSPRTILIGNGPGQAYAQVTHLYVRVAGNGLLAFFPGIGIIGTLAYAAMLFKSCYNAYRLSKCEEYESEIRLFAEQMMSFGIYVIVMDFYAPSYYYVTIWVVVAMGMYFEKKLRGEF